MSNAPRIIVNAVERMVHDDAHGWLLGWLRDDLGLTGTKYGCGERACGACSVLIDGALARACVVSTPDVLGRSISTIEGLSDTGQILNPTFTRYRVPRMTDAPPIEIVLLDRPDLASAGAGETPIITIAPAIANAIFDATGRRIRSLPLLEHSDLRTRDVPS